jgi:hypothetical protein
MRVGAWLPFPRAGSNVGLSDVDLGSRISRSACHVNCDGSSRPNKDSEDIMLKFVPGSSGHNVKVGYVEMVVDEMLNMWPLYP